MQRRMLDAAAAIPGVTNVGYIDHLMLGLGGGDSYVFTDSTTDYRPTNLAADAMNYHISPGYMGAAGKSANCQVNVQVAITDGLVAVPVGAQLYLPESWTKDRARCREAGVPDEGRGGAECR